MASPLFQEALLAYLDSNPRTWLPSCIKTARLQCGVHSQACLRHRLPPAIGPLLPFCGTSGNPAAHVSRDTGRDQSWQPG